MKHIHRHNVNLDIGNDKNDSNLKWSLLYGYMHRIEHGSAM